MREKLQNIITVSLFFVFPYFFVQPATAQTYGPEQKITVVQNFPDAVRPGNDFMVEIKINKGNVTGLAKFQQYIPPGMTATAMESAGADFSFEQQNVKLIWTSVPQDPNITLRYKISVSSTLKGKKNLSGTFSYVENDRTKRASLLPKEIDITPEAPATEVASTETKPQETQPEKTETAPASTSPSETTPEATETKKDEEETPPAEAPVVPSALSSTPAETKKTEESVPAETTTPSKTILVDAATETKTPENVTPPVSTGIVFKVQIAAMNEKHFRRKNYFQEKFGIQMEVTGEEHDGLKKYTVGSFTSYAQARKLRDEIQASVEGCFVVAYKDGVRISVSEAMELLRKK